MKTFLTSAVMLASLCAIYANPSDVSNELFGTQASKLAAEWDAEGLQTELKSMIDEAIGGDETRTTTSHPKIDAMIEKVFDAPQERDDVRRRILELVPSFTND